MIKAEPIIAPFHVIITTQIEVLFTSNLDVVGGEDHNFGELEFMLENERKKFKESKERFEYDLDNERKLRIEFENKLIKLKDEFSRKEVIISEL